MYEFLPYLTNDYSVGLFSKVDNDIYHSAFGAITEAYEKFINPLLMLNDIFKSKINVLDICYGIGYNTKAFISMLINTKKYLHIDNVNIDCVDNNKVIMELSPFINNRIDLFSCLLYKNKFYKNVENYIEVEHILKNNKKIKTGYKIDDSSQIILIKNLINNDGSNFISDNAKKIMFKNENSPFFDKRMLKIYDFLSKNDIYLHQNKNKSGFVHNIYYKYLSKRYNLDKYNNLFNISFNAEDIRTYLKAAETRYNIIFLDGFTPSKCPVIWTLDLFKKLHELLNEDGVIVTYNKSAAVRNALLEAGFFIGNTLNKNKVIGTIASKNQKFILNHLSEEQRGILKTKAGIPYRDRELELDNELILTNRKIEFSNSKLISSSEYIKKYKNIEVKK